MAKEVVSIDSEINFRSKKIDDLGAYKANGEQFQEFIANIPLVCGRPCYQRCPYCQSKFDIRQKLRSYFGYDEFRTYDGEPLQEKAVDATVNEYGDESCSIYVTPVPPQVNAKSTQWILKI